MEVNLKSKAYQVKDAEVDNYKVSADNVEIKNGVVNTIEGGIVRNADAEAVCTFSLTSYEGSEPSISIPTCKRSVNAISIINAFCEAVEDYDTNN